MQMDVFGLNHLSYYTAVKENGTDITRELLFDPKLYSDTDMRYFEPELPQSWNVMMNEYLYYFYYREEAVQNILKSEYTRGESILAINRDMLSELKNLDPEKDFSRMLEIYSKYNHLREISYMAAESSIQRNETAQPAFDCSGPKRRHAGIALAYIRQESKGRQ